MIVANAKTAENFHFRKFSAMGNCVSTTHRVCHFTQRRDRYDRSGSASASEHDSYGYEEGRRIFPSTKRLRDVEQTTESPLPTRLAEETSTLNDNLPLERVPTPPFRSYCTLRYQHVSVACMWNMKITCTSSSSLVTTLVER
nr:hypothetical protein HmN_000318500 [Hymenolepis microstoma]